jgi:hypothetical protein
VHRSVCRTKPLQIYVPRAQSHDPLLSALCSLNDAFVDKIKESWRVPRVSGMSVVSDARVYTRPAGSKADWYVA